jgi:hypothetical protein
LKVCEKIKKPKRWMPKILTLFKCQSSEALFTKKSDEKAKSTAEDEKQ